MCICLFFPKRNSPRIYFCDDLSIDLPTPIPGYINRVLRCRVSIFTRKPQSLLSLPSYEDTMTRYHCTGKQIHTKLASPLALKNAASKSRGDQLLPCLSYPLLCFNHHFSFGQAAQVPERLFCHSMGLHSDNGVLMGHIWFFSSWRKCKRNHLIIFVE